tara:strand:+ start:236 stop:403 length:168 start_codon:yes stop_codon:yes gene_type:complete
MIDTRMTNAFAEGSTVSVGGLEVPHRVRVRVRVRSRSRSRVRVGHHHCRWAGGAA